MTIYKCVEGYFYTLVNQSYKNCGFLIKDAWYPVAEFIKGRPSNMEEVEYDLIPDTIKKVIMANQSVLLDHFRVENAKLQ